MRSPAAIPLFAATCLYAQTGGIAGVTVDPSGAPVAGVHLRLVASPNSDFIPDFSYGATSDKTGRFAFEKIEPGIYLMIGERTGFLPLVTGIPTLEVRAGEHLADYRFVMVARTIIRGRVVDEYGDPVPSVQVGIKPAGPEPPGFGAGRPFGQTDDRGEYRLATVPGKYHVYAAPVQNFGGVTEIRTNGTSAAPFVTTYYPSASSQDSAAVVEGAAGEDLAGIDVRLLRRPPSARSLTVSGVTTGGPDKEPVQVVLRFGDKAGEPLNTVLRVVGADGKFSFNEMPPGYYSILAYSLAGKVSLRSHILEFHLDSSDRTDLQLALSSGEELEGKLEFRGAPAGRSGKYAVRLQEVGGLSFGQPQATCDSSGAFRLTDVPPGKFRVVVDPMPENGYLLDVAVDGKSIPEGILDFTQGVAGARLKVTVGWDGGQISGRVVDRGGEPVVGATILLGTDARHLIEDGRVQVRDGKFSFKNLHPGKYQIVAPDFSRFRTAYRTDEDRIEELQRLLDAGEEIAVKDGDRIAKDVPLLTRLPEKKGAQ